MTPSRPGSDAELLLELRHVSKVYGTGHAAVHALRDVSLRVRRGEFAAFMGSSGSGKSTCLNMLGCLDRPTAGDYIFQGVDAGHLDADRRALLRRHYLGFVFQGFNLLARTSALENVELPLVYQGVGPLKRRELARRALDDVGLAGWEHHTPAELSGGQQQRVAIARAVVSSPEILLADEPTGNLDSKRSHEVMELLVRMRLERGLTILMVTHEVEMAAYADRIVRFHDGRIVGVEYAGEQRQEVRP